MKVNVSLQGDLVLGFWEGLVLGLQGGLMSGLV